MTRLTAQAGHYDPDKLTAGFLDSGSQRMRPLRGKAMPFSEVLDVLFRGRVL